MKVLVACEYSGRVRDAFIKRGHDAVSCDLLPTDSPGPHIQGDVLGLLDAGWDLMIAHPPMYLPDHRGRVVLQGQSGEEDGPWGSIWRRAQAGEGRCCDLFRKLLEAPIPRIAVENPVGVISSRIRKPNQVIHPWQYGDDASKGTCLWLKGLAPLVPDPAVVIAPKGWKLVRMAADMGICDCCDEPYCWQCNMHYSDCECMGPTVDEAEYKEHCGFLFGTLEKTPSPKMLWANQTPSGQNNLGPSAELLEATKYDVSRHRSRDGGTVGMTNAPIS